MRVGAIIQARMASTRLPGKVLLPAPDGRPLLAVMLERVRRASRLDEIIVATTENEEDNAIINVARRCGVEFATGSESDVLGRFYRTAVGFNLDAIVRLTADCPLVDEADIDHLIWRRAQMKWDYIQTGPGFPEGADVEAFSLHALSSAFEVTDDSHDREHVTPWMRRELYFQGKEDHGADSGHIRYTVDYPEDLLVVRSILERVGSRARRYEIAGLYAREPHLWEPSKHIERNEWAKEGQAA